MAELFLQELKPLFLARPTPDLGCDFLLGALNEDGGINFFAVEVKATERPVPGRYPLQARALRLLASSNIPALLLVVDVKQNKLFYSWLSGELAQPSEDRQQVMVPVVEIGESGKQELIQQLAGRTQASSGHD